MIELCEIDGIALVRMAHRKANAMSLEFCDELIACFEQVRLSPARAMVLTGQGTIFSAGVDLVRVLEGGKAYVRSFLPALNAMFMAAFSHPKPVIAAVNGHAIAGGCVLACACDRRVAARTESRIGVPELLVGVAFPAVAMEIMRAAAAPEHFEQLIFDGNTYAPVDALARGLVNEIVEPQELMERAMGTAMTLAKLPPAVFALSKRQTRQPALERLERVGSSIDAAAGEIWTAPETLDRIRHYVSRTFKKV
ncbi:MAG: enoyl-CoA hydratase/isomerase family protein [Xanthobacteraceae bacterium]